MNSFDPEKNIKEIKSLTGSPCACSEFSKSFIKRWSNVNGFRRHMYFGDASFYGIFGQLKHSKRENFIKIVKLNQYGRTNKNNCLVVVLWLHELVIKKNEKQRSNAISIEWLRFLLLSAWRIELIETFGGNKETRRVKGCLLSIRTDYPFPFIAVTNETL